MHMYTYTHTHNTYSCFTYPTTVPGGDCTSISCRQQKQHHAEQRKGLSKWITSLPLLSVMDMAKGLWGPQYWRTIQLESKTEKYKCVITQLGIQLFFMCTYIRIKEYVTTSEQNTIAQNLCNYLLSNSKISLLIGNWNYSKKINQPSFNDYIH